MNDQATGFLVGGAFTWLISGSVPPTVGGRYTAIFAGLGGTALAGATVKTKALRDGMLLGAGAAAILRAFQTIKTASPVANRPMGQYGMGYDILSDCGGGDRHNDVTTECGY